MKKTAKRLIIGFALIPIVQFSCRTLSTSQETRPSGSAINGMLYYLPIGKITIKGEVPQTRVKIGSSSHSSPRDQPGGGDGSSEGGIAISGGALTITVGSEVEADERAGEYT